MQIFQEIKQSTDIRKIMEFYGVKFRRNTALCCFHNEKTPSMTISESKQIFRCHGCGIGGDSIYFVSRLKNISHLEAAKTINSDLKLKLAIEMPIQRRKTNQKDISEAKKKIELNKQHREDLRFQKLWSRHKDLRQYPPTEEFWENLENLLKTEECKYDGL